MAKGPRKAKGRRKGDDSDEEDGNYPTETAIQHGNDGAASGSNGGKLDFAARRQLQRQQAAEQRRAKQRCYLCGQSGHVRRECPGIMDDGRGESRFKNAKGDRGARHNSKKGGKNKGRNRSDSKDYHGLELPPGFHSREYDSAEELEEKEESEKTSDDDFLYFDASCDLAALVEYQRTGRGKKKLSAKEAAVEYQQVSDEINSNFAGCLSRSLVRPNRPWMTPLENYAFTNHHHAVWHVVGLARDFLCTDDDIEKEEATQALVDVLQQPNEGETSTTSTDVPVGVFCDLDFTPAYTERPGCDRNAQARRMSATVAAAVKANLTIQIRVLPACPHTDDDEQTETQEAEASQPSPYKQVMVELVKLLETTYKDHEHLRVHLSSWSGCAEHMLLLLNNFPGLSIGMNASVTFAKAKNIHECAFDLDYNRLVLETSHPQIIPSAITKALGREAFGHSKLCIPWIAQGLAKYANPIHEYTAEAIAKMTSTNMLRLYPTLSLNTSQHTSEP